MSETKNTPKKETADAKTPEKADAPVVEKAVVGGYERRVVDANLRSTAYGATLDSSHDQAAEDAKAAKGTEGGSE